MPIACVSLEQTFSLGLLDYIAFFIFLKTLERTHKYDSRPKKTLGRSHILALARFMCMLRRSLSHLCASDTDLIRYLSIDKVTFKIMT